MNINLDFLSQPARRNLSIVGILVLCIFLPGAEDGCVVEQKETEGVITFSISAEWATAGFVEANDSDSYTLTQEDIDAIADAINDLDNVSEIGRPRIAGAKYNVKTNDGHVAARSGTVRANGDLLLTFTNIMNTAGTSGSAGDGSLTLEPAGITTTSDALETFVQQVRSGAPATALDGFTFDAMWSSVPPPGDCDPPDPTCDTFTWCTELIIQVPVTFSFDGPA